MEIDETPLKPQFEFRGVKTNGGYSFAIVKLTMYPEEGSMGIFTATLRLPIRDQDQRVSEIRAGALELAERTVATSALRSLLSRSQ